MQRLLIFTILIILPLMKICGKGLTINEVMPCNISTQINTDNYNFSGYIEFLNENDEPTNLKEMVLTHFKKKGNGEFELKWEWEIDTDLIVDESGGLKLIWMDEEDKTGHSPYKLDADGGYLTLYDGAILVDSFAYEKGDAHISYGRYNRECGFMSPSPLSINSFAVKSLTSDYRCSAPQFSQKPGILSESIYVTITSSTSNATIYYTLDGSEPTDTSGIVYSEAILIDKISNLRARAYKEEMMPSKITTGTYLFEDEKRSECGGFSLPIVSLTTNDDYLNDPMIGILITGKNGISGEKTCVYQKANYNQDWKRAINFEYIVDGVQVLSQEVEAAVEGGCSRSNSVKSLSLKASKKTGKENFSYYIFGDKPQIQHQTIHLRNGGQGFSEIRFRDGLTQSLAKGLNIDYQAYQPVAYYLNGEYIGLMGLRERTNSDYIKANYGYNDDEIDLVTISDQLGITANRGTLDAYNQLVDYLSNNDSGNASYYKDASRLMDMDEYIEYQIFQQFIANTDWPGNNTKMWRLKNNGRFRWIMFDTDFGMGYQGTDASKNMIEWCQAKGSTNWGNDDPWMTVIFSNLSENKEFKQLFVTKYLQHLSTTFSESRINMIFDSICGKIEEEYCVTKNKSAVSESASMRNFALKRPSYIYEHLIKYVQGDSLVNLDITSNIDGAVFMINGERVSSYQEKYISGMSLDLSVYAPYGYRFVNWVITPESQLINGETVSTKLINKQSNWRYYYAEEAPDSEWSRHDYNDSDWLNGSGIFGFNTQNNIFFNPSSITYDVTLDYGSNSRKKYMTAYFRNSFTIDNLSNISSIDGSISYDDGYVLYINGVEVERTNIKEGEVSHTTAATKDVSTEQKTFSIDPSYFVEGENTIAVEVHLNKASSTNMTFDFEMSSNQFVPIEEENKKDNVLKMIVKSDQKIEAIFEKEENPQPLTLQLNEVCASSNKNSGNPDDYGDYPDWIEIYNYGTEPCDLAGLYITDNKNNWKKFQFPYGSSETLIEPKERKIIWAKGNIQYDPLYLDFKLSASNTTAIILSQDIDGELTVIDYLQTYEKHPTNGSYGRKTDGDESWMVFGICSDSSSLATPNNANGTEVCPEETSLNTLYDETFSMICYPNPTSTDINIRSKEEIENICLYDITGILFVNINPHEKGCSIDISSLRNGIYLLEVKTESNVYKKKIIKEYK